MQINEQRHCRINKRIQEVANQLPCGTLLIDTEHGRRLLALKDRILNPVDKKPIKFPLTRNSMVMSKQNGY